MIELTPAYTLKGHQASVYGTRWLSNGNILSWSQDWTLKVWDAQTGKLLQTLSDPARMMSGYGGIRGAIQLINHQIVSWGFDGVIHVWQLPSEKPIHRLVAHSQAVTGVVVLPSGKLLSWAGDMSFWVWDPHRTGAPVRLPIVAVWEDMISHRPPFILLEEGIVCWASNEIMFFPYAAQVPQEILAEEAQYISLSIRLRNGNVITFAEGGALCEWQVPALVCVTKYASVAAFPMDLFELNDGRFLTRAAGRIWLWNTGHEEAEILLDPLDDAIAGVAPLPLGGLVYRTLQHRKLVMWNEKIQWTATLPEWKEPIRLIPIDTNRIVVWSARESEMVIVGPDRQYLLNVAEGSFTDVALRTDTTSISLLTATSAGNIHCWQLP